MALYDYLDKYTPQYLLKSALSIVANTVDKREGGIIFDTLSPLSMVASYLLGMLKMCLMQTDVETATGDFLELITSERGIYRQEAVGAQKIILVTPTGATLPIGTTMRTDAGLKLTWEVTEDRGDGYYTVLCQTAGAEGGSDYGALTLSEPIDGVKYIVFTESIFDGKDEESDVELRIRFWQKLVSDSYGGNFDNYKEWCFVGFLSTEGIALDGIQFYPSSRYLGGGNVLIRPTVTENSDLYVPASNGAVENLKDYLDPIGVSGLGAGVVPVGHRVTVQSIFRSTRNLNITVNNGGKVITDEQKSDAEADLREEFNSIRARLVSTLNEGFPTGGYSSSLLRDRIVAAIYGEGRQRFEEVLSVVYADGSVGSNAEDSLAGLPVSDETITSGAFTEHVYLPVLGTITIEAGA